MKEKEMKKQKNITGEETDEEKDHLLELEPVNVSVLESPRAESALTESLSTVLVRHSPCKNKIFD